MASGSVALVPEPGGMGMRGPWDSCVCVCDSRASESTWGTGRGNRHIFRARGSHLVWRTQYVVVCHTEE